MSASQRRSRPVCSMRSSCSRAAGTVWRDHSTNSGTTDRSTNSGTTAELATVCCAALLVTSSCDRAVEPGTQLPPLQASSLDATAGSWRMIVLTGPTQIAVAAPTAVTSAAYVAEIAAIKSAQTNLTS